MSTIYISYIKSSHTILAIVSYLSLTTFGCNQLAKYGMVSGQSVQQSDKEQEKINSSPTIGSDSCTPLHFASQKGHLEVVKALLEDKRILINEKNKDGCT
ncbi:ankyrin repeat domain-containing protein, partial [Candidatus Cardinium hertigii]|uniref:ankyrin repeat domain-containing protein n=1 Tax=Candidatus Cardinium hertigii TaxID=247481 RepID=UPI003D7C47EA